MIFKSKICQGCGKEYTPTNGRQKWCAKCGSQVRREYAAQYGATHKQEIAEKSKRWNAAHPDRVVAYGKKRQLEHREELRAYGALWYVANREQRTAQIAVWQKANPDLIRAAEKAWIASHPEQMRAKRRRAHAKRRVLAFVPLNLPFAGSEAHHIDKEHVVFIPKELHKSVSHDIWVGRNMEQINALAMRWLVESST